MAKEPLRAIVDINGVKVEQQLINNYRSILAQALGQEVIVEQKSVFSAKSFDILISDNSALMPSWYQPVYILDIFACY